MADMTEFFQKTVAILDTWYERNNRVSYNKYLAMSEMGELCSRKLWYKFRNYLPKEQVPGRVQRIFETGHEQEARVIKGLQGIALVGNTQARVEACSGHLQGAIDFEILGIAEAPKTLHIGECKSHSDDNFKKIVKEGVKESFFKHFVQFTLYGFLRGLTRYFYIAVNKNDESIFIERGEVDQVLAMAQLNRAERIIQATTPPERIDKKDCYTCRFCEMKDICHDGAPHHVGIRNDGTHKPGPNGLWVPV